jgi:hypothetical protein
MKLEMMMKKMVLKMRNMIVRVFMMIRRRHIGKKIMIIRIILIIKRIRNKLRFKIKKTLILKQEKEESKKENRER